MNIKDTKIYINRYLRTINKLIGDRIMNDRRLDSFELGVEIGEYFERVSKIIPQSVMKTEEGRQMRKMIYDFKRQTIAFCQHGKQETMDRGLKMALKAVKEWEA